MNSQTPSQIAQRLSVNRHSAIQMNGNKRNGYRVYLDGISVHQVTNKREAEDIVNALLNKKDKAKIAAGLKPAKNYLPDWEERAWL